MRGNCLVFALPCSPIAPMSLLHSRTHQDSGTNFPWEREQVREEMPDLDRGTEKSRSFWNTVGGWEGTWVARSFRQSQGALLP